jgi:hypothetical protein
VSIATKSAVFIATIASFNAGDVVMSLSIDFIKEHLPAIAASLCRCGEKRLILVKHNPVLIP